MTSPSAPAPVVSIVDDQADIRMVLRATVRSEPRLALNGEAASAEDALRDASSWAPDVILLDQSLETGMSGIEAAPGLKQLLPEVRIVLFSAYDLEAEANASPHIDAFLRKDNLSQLLPLLRRLLKLK